MAYPEKYQGGAKPNITVYFLQASRCIRTSWLLEELNLPYKLEFADRQNLRAPQAFKDASGNPLGKFPTLRDGDLVIHESGAITEYICEKYDASDRLIPLDPYLRTRTQTLIHAAEGTMALHALAVLYARWNFPKDFKESHPQAAEQLEEGLSVNVKKDFDWLEAELGRSTGAWFVGNQITAADIMLHFSVSFVLERQLGTKGGSWPKLQEWVKRCEDTDSYKRAVEKSGYTLYPATT